MWQASYGSCFELRERRGKVRLERMDPGFCSESRSRTKSVSRFLVQPRETPFHRRSEQIDRNRASVIFTIERCVASAAIGLIERKLCRLRQEEEVAKTKKQKEEGMQQQRCKKKSEGIIIHNSFIQWFPQVSHSGSVATVPGKYFATKVRIGGDETRQK